MLSFGDLILILIAIVILLIWGPEKLPKLARAFGEAIREFKHAASGGARREKEEIRRGEEEKGREIPVQ